MSIGGISFGHGIAFSSSCSRARAVWDSKGNLRVQVTKPKRRSSGKLAKVPFIRGIALLLSFRPMLAVLLAALALDVSPLFAGPDTTALDNALGWVAVAFLAALILIRLFFMRDALKYHAAEHMALNAYESGKELTVENIMASPRTHPRCGTILAIYVVLVAVPLSFLIPYTGAVLLLAASLSYELFQFAPKVRWLYGLTALGLWLQKAVTTAPPELRHVETARACLRALLDS